MVENENPIKIKKQLKKKYDILNEPDDDDTEDDSVCGIYTKKICQTKKELTEIHTINYLKDLDEKASLASQKKPANFQEEEDSEVSETETDESINTSSEDELYKAKSYSPPPPPALAPVSNSKPTLKNSIDFGFIDNINRIKRDESINFENESLNDTDTDGTITVRVATKNGVRKWEISKNTTFKCIFKDLSEKENVAIDSIVLMLNDTRLSHGDTPMSVDLQICDILDFCKISKPARDRIQIIESDDESEANNDTDLIAITLQGEEGRKSRVKFLISKDEKFANVLKKYCDKKEFEFNQYMLEFDGEQVDLDENPNDLDLDGDEIFDVKYSKNITKINEKKYEFDDDVLIA